MLIKYFLNEITINQNSLYLLVFFFYIKFAFSRVGDKPCWLDYDDNLIVSNYLENNVKTKNQEDYITVFAQDSNGNQKCFHDIIMRRIFNNADNLYGFFI